MKVRHTDRVLSDRAEVDRLFHFESFEMADYQYCVLVTPLHNRREDDIKRIDMEASDYFEALLIGIKLWRRQA